MSRTIFRWILLPPVAALLVLSLYWFSSAVSAEVSMPIPGVERVRFDQTVVSTQDIVELNAGVTLTEFFGKYNTLQPLPGYTLEELNAFVTRIPTSALREQIASDPLVESVTPDAYMPNMLAGQTIPTGIKRTGAINSVTADINGSGPILAVDIAIIDTGIKLPEELVNCPCLPGHQDLNVFKNVNFVNTNLRGDDDNGHGTIVAGVAAAKDNNVGGVGMAPGARLWAVKVLDADGAGTLSSVLAGMNYVAKNAAKIEVVNMSTNSPASALSASQLKMMTKAVNAMTNKGVVVVVSAGNDRKNVSTVVPAKLGRVIAVSAIADYDGTYGAKGTPPAGCTSTERDDTFASFSNFGAGVDIAAPGVCLLTTTVDGNYGVFSGTSAASPYVAGAVALHILKTGNKPANWTQVSNELEVLQNNGKEQDGTFGFSGDPDSFPEKLLWARPF